MIKKRPVKIDDVNLAEKSFGPDIGALKVKITRRNHKPVKYGILEVLPGLIDKHNDMKHCMDIIFVNEIPMITGIHSNIRYRPLVCLNR